MPELYILHQDFDYLETYFGPFAEDEIHIRLNDLVGDMLAACGNVEIVRLGKIRAGQIYINPPEMWMEQLVDMQTFVKHEKSVGRR